MSSGTTASSDPRRLVGQVVSGRYRVDELIGEGGMGAVYRATHLGMGKRVAVKVLHAGVADFDEAALRFEREAVAAAHVEHPNVATATDFGKLEDGSHFLVLELLEGADLRSALASGPLSIERALALTRQVALGLRAAHRLGIVHRDLKPENVMLTQKDGTEIVKILDFGLAKVPVERLGPASTSSKAALTQRGMAYGTPEYMAPEQALGQDVDGRADLYALGVVLFEMLTGTRPITTEDRSKLLAAVVEAPPRRLDELRADIPASVQGLVARLLAKHPSDRFAEADELALAIDEVLIQLGGPPTGRRSLATPPDGDAARRAAEPAALARASMATMAVPPQGGSARTRASLPSSPALPRPSGPSAALLAAAGAVFVTGVVVVAIVARSDASLAALEGSAAAPVSSSAGAASASAAPPASAVAAKSDRAPGDELEAARARGLAALGALAQRYPDDPDVLKALMLAHGKDREGYSAALGVARKLFTLAPESARDPDVKTLMLMTANGKPDVATVALDLMASRMGSTGPDLLFELTTASGIGKLPKDRADALLRDPGVRKVATPALRIANELRVATACNRRPLFARAGQDGDHRSLGYLKPLLATNGCSAGGIFGKFVGSKTDCYVCLGNRADLRAAIDQIEGRLER